jgi:membrane associated rhomboid family serine protease
MVYFNRPGLPTGIRNLLIVTLAVFVLQVLPVTEHWTMRWGALVPYEVFRRGEVWRLLTYMFLHGGPFHLFFNLLALWMFGVEIEQLWGTRRFVVFYLAGGVCSGLLSVFMAPGVFVIGASGAVLAVLTVYAF